MTIRILAASAALLVAAGGNASTVVTPVSVAWTNWASPVQLVLPTTVYEDAAAPDYLVATGIIVSGTTTVDLSLTTSGESINFLQTGAGTNYFTEPNSASKPYTGGIVSDAPPAAEMVSLSAGGTKTITFSQAVTNPYIAFVSWNGNAATFSQPFEKISEGCGYWGCGTFDLGPNNTFVGNGEVHGILRFVGTFTTLSFTDSSEMWHGFTVGIGGVADPVPEPASWALLISGFAMVGARLRRPRAITA